MSATRAQAEAEMEKAYSHVMNCAMACMEARRDHGVESPQYFKARQRVERAARRFCAAADALQRVTP